MRFVLPRLVLGNRGDLASRWGLLHTLHQLGVQDVTIFSQFPSDVPSLSYPCLRYGRFFNLLPRREGWHALRKADTVLWAVGLDIQDDSSLGKLLYLWVAFRLYRLLGLRVWCLFQGAGPLLTSLGKKIAAGVLKEVELFVARDPGTIRLIGDIHPGVERILAHDAIFLPNFEKELAGLSASTQTWLDALCKVGGRPVIGINLRQWFHFSSDWLPYEFSQKRYLKRSLPRMKQLLHSAKELVQRLRAEQQARVLLISGYQPEVVPWEDDLPWLKQIKAHFPDDPEVIVIDHPIALPVYFGLMSRLSLMIGMRLHSSLIALRLGVPSINLNYTLKGRDIMGHLSLSKNVIDLEDFLKCPARVYGRAAEILSNQTVETENTQMVVQKAVRINLQILRSLINGHQRPVR